MMRSSVILVAALGVAALSPRRALATDTLLVPQSYPTIQAAIDAAAPGDEIIVADGVYSGVGFSNINPHGKPVTIRAQHPQQAILRDTGRTFLFESGESALTAIRDFQIEAGYVNSGQGVYHCRNASSPTITNCWTRSSFADALVLCETNSAPSLTGCAFFYSTSPAIASNNGSPSLIGCSFGDLGSGSVIIGTGGALSLDGCSFSVVDAGAAPVVRMTNCVLAVGNTSFNEVLLGTGRMIVATNCRSTFDHNLFEFVGDISPMSGIEIQQGSADIIDCAFSNNHADLGSALLATSATVRVINSRFSSNGASAFSSTHAGGDIFASNCDLSVTGTRHVGSVATRGGSICVEGGILNLADSNLTSHAISRGGALDFSGAAASIVRCSFTECATDHSSPPNIPWSTGGAIYATEASFQMFDSTFLSCVADLGGAVYLNHCAPDRPIERCDFTQNAAHRTGGALHDSASSPLIIDCIFQSGSIIPGSCSTDGYNCGGAGIYSRDSSPTVLRTHFTSTDAGGAGIGGAFSCVSAAPRLESCDFRLNSGFAGGAVAATDSSTSIVDSVFEDGLSITEGAAVWCRTGNLAVSRCQFLASRAYSGGAAIDFFSTSIGSITDSIFIGSRRLNSTGGAAVIRASHATACVIANCDFVNNTLELDPVVRAEATGMIDIRNSIFRENSGPLWAADGGATVQFAYCNTHPALAGPGNIDADPRFVRSPNPGPDATWGTSDDDFGDLQLQPTSPCIDAGSNSRLAPDRADSDFNLDTAEPDPLDAAGAVRRVDVATITDTGEGIAPIVDIGAYELSNMSIFEPCDWDRSGAVSSEDFFLFLTDFFANRADFDHDGRTTSNDFFAFVACFLSH